MNNIGFDITLRDEENDPKWESYFIKSNIESVVNQIINIIFTNKTEVLGYENFGMSTYNLLFELNANIQQIYAELSKQLDQYLQTEEDINYEYDIKLIEDENGRYILLLLNINEERLLSIIIR